MRYVVGNLLFVCLLGLSLQAIARTPFVTLTVAGDTMLANSPTNSIPSKNLLLPVSHIMKAADIAFLNYEGTLCDQEIISHKCKGKKAGELCYAFRGPTKIASYVADAGVDIVSLANNHIFDYGHDCATQTKSAFTSVGVKSVGLMSNEKKDPMETADFITFKGKKIAFIGFHYSDAWGRVISINDEATVRSVLRFYRDKADITVVSFHAGGEGPDVTRTPPGMEIFAGESRGNSRRFARIAIDEGADLVVGHGPHVVRGLEMYQNKLIIYSLGNFATYDLFSLQPYFNAGAIIEVGLDEDGSLVQGKIHSIKQDYIRPGEKRAGIYVMQDPQNTAAGLIQKMSTLDFQNPPKIENDGKFLP